MAASDNLIVSIIYKMIHSFPNKREHLPTKLCRYCMYESEDNNVSITISVMYFDI